MPETVQELSQFATVPGASDSFVSETGSGEEGVRTQYPTMPPTVSSPVTVPALLQPFTTLSIAPPTMPPALYSPPVIVPLLVQSLIVLRVVAPAMPPAPAL